MEHIGVWQGPRAGGVLQSGKSEAWGLIPLGREELRSASAPLSRSSPLRSADKYPAMTILLARTATTRWYFVLCVFLRLRPCAHVHQLGQMKPNGPGRLVLFSQSRSPACSRESERELAGRVSWPSLPAQTAHPSSVGQLEFTSQLARRHANKLSFHWPHRCMRLPSKSDERALTP